MRDSFLYILLVTILLLTACQKEIDWETASGDIDKLVVEGILTNEYKNHEIKLSTPYHNPNSSQNYVSDAIVFVTNSVDTVYFSESESDNGLYVSDFKFSANISTIYYLTVLYDNKTYHANTNVKPVSPSNIFSYNFAAGSTEFYQINWTAPEYSSTEQAMYEVIVDWTHLVDPTIEDTISIARLLHYTFNTIDVSYNIFPQDKENILFPVGSTIVSRKYSLTDEYAMFLRALLASTEWQGSLFEDSRSNLPTNISNNGLGFFSACSVITDTTFTN